MTRDRRPTAIRLSLAALGLLLLGAPLAAQDQQEQRDASGLIIQVDAWWVSPRNTGLDYAFILPGSNVPGGQLQTMTYERATIPVIEIGWRFNAPGSLEVAARLWEFSETASASVAAANQGIGALLANPNFSIGQSFVDSATASGELRSIAADLGVKWTHEVGNSGELTVFGGFRVFRFEESFDVGYRRDLGGQVDAEFINSTSDAKGLGLSTTVGYRQKLGKRFGLGIGLGFAVPVGDQELQVSDVAGTCTTPECETITNPMASEVQVDETRAFLQLGGKFGFQAQLSRGWSVHLSYDVEYWGDVRRSQRFVDVRSRNTAVEGSQDVVWEGWRVGFRYSFP